MTTVLLTGFEPFHGNAVNPSQIIAEWLNGETIAGVKIVGLTLPVVFGEDTRRVFPAIAALRPALVLSLGLSAGTDSLDLEMFAINHRVGDGSNTLQPILADGPAAYFPTLDIDRTCAAVKERTSLPIRRHGYAGSYLCNHILYQTLHHIATRQLPCAAGFLHIPQATEYAEGGQPSLPLEQMAEGARIAIEAAISAADAASPY